MTFFQDSLERGYVRKVERDVLRARSLFKSSQEALLTVADIALVERSLKTILRESYEALHQYCEGIGYLRGYKFETHESIVHFLHDILLEESISLAFDRYRKLRNGINYYGRDVSLENVEKALIEIPSLIRKLEKYSGSNATDCIRGNPRTMRVYSSRKPV